MLEPEKKICFITNGCPENRIDSAGLKALSKAIGSFVVDEYQHADIVFFNACGLTQDSESLSVNIIKKICAQKKPRASLIIHGCLPRINKKILENACQDSVRIVDRFDMLSEFFKTDLNLWDIRANYLVPRMETSLQDRLKFSYIKNKFRLKSIIQYLTSTYTRQFDVSNNVTRPNTFLIKLSTGCLNACSFCAVRLSRGRLQSKPFNQVLLEFQYGLEKNYKKFALIGTEVGAYGRDLGTDLNQLLKAILENRGDYTMMLRNIHPRFLIDRMGEFREILKSEKISWISTAVESGNNRILKLMNRGYSIEDFKENIHLLNTDFPWLQIRTQFIVGFPSETEEEFNDTARLLDELRFDYAEVYKFETRPGTTAAKMDDQIPEKIARDRHFKLYMKSALNLWTKKRKKLKKRNEERAI